MSETRIKASVIQFQAMPRDCFRGEPARHGLGENSLKQSSMLTDLG